MKVVTEVLAERVRHTEIGHSPVRDDVYVSAELASAAAAYALSATGSNIAPLVYPWPVDGFHSTLTPRQALVWSAALAIAEVERLDRLSGATS